MSPRLTLLLQEKDFDLCSMAKAISIRGVEDTKELSSLEEEDLKSIMRHIKSKNEEPFVSARTKSQKKKILVEINEEIENYIREECWCMVYKV